MGKHIRIYNPPTADAWRMAVELAAVEAARDQGWEPSDEPMELNAIFFMPRPKAHYRSNGELKPNAPLYCGTKPDLSNIIKGTEDALEQSGVIARDQLIVALHCVKVYAGEEDVGATLTLSKAVSRTKADNHG
jgi:Holliday junction resolvase RusA-like endonuclease